MFRVEKVRYLQKQHAVNPVDTTTFQPIFIHSSPSPVLLNKNTTGSSALSRSARKFHRCNEANVKGKCTERGTAGKREIRALEETYRIQYATNSHNSLDLCHDCTIKGRFSCNRQI